MHALAVELVFEPSFFMEILTLQSTYHIITNIEIILTIHYNVIRLEIIYVRCIELRFVQDQKWTFLLLVLPASNDQYPVNGYSALVETTLCSDSDI